jgi:hypothetical protein
MRATALAGIVMCAVAVAGFVIATALGNATWPFALFSVVGGASFLAGSVVYRARGYKSGSIEVEHAFNVRTVRNRQHRDVHHPPR